MGKEYILAKRYPAAGNHRVERNTAQFLHRSALVSADRQRHKYHPRLTDGDAELSRNPIAEIRGADFRNRKTAGCNDDRLAFQFAKIGGELEPRFLLNRCHIAFHEDGDACLFGFLEQHLDDLLRETVAEQLTELLFMIGNPMTLHH